MAYETVVDLERDEVVFLAGKKYVRGILPYVRNAVEPLEGLKLFDRVPFLRHALGE